MFKIFIFCHDIYYYVKVWIILVHDYVILKEFQIFKKMKMSFDISSICCGPYKYDYTFKTK
jgi:hypothetical protein